MRILLIVLVLCLSASSVPAQESAPQPQTSTPQAAPPSESQAPVPVPEPSETAISYYRSGIALWIVGIIWGMLIPALILFSGFSAKIRNLAQGLGQKWFFIVGIYFIIYSLITFVIDLPLGFYAGYVREHSYGLSNQSLGKWVSDSLIGLAISLVVGFLFLWIPYLLLRKSPRRWWLFTSLLAIPFLFLVILVTPVWIDPLFNKFGPMQDKALEAKILDLARRAGIEGSRVYEVDKSTDTKALNAYVTGFAGTKRIVLWDTIIKRLDQDELLFVMGHEMGHYVLGHVWRTIPMFALLILISLFAIHRTAGWMIDKYWRRFGFTELSDIASFPLIILLFSFYLFLILPVGLAFSRYNEREADRFGLEITRNNRAAATAFVKLQSDNLAVPRPNRWISLWRASHPSLGERIDFCNQYRPWQTGEPLKYSELIRE